MSSRHKINCFGFCQEIKPTDSFDLLENRSHLQFPFTEGCYALGSSDTTQFVYPWGRSSIFYIGMAKSLCNRLRQHRDYIRKALTDQSGHVYTSKYQYGAAFGSLTAVYQSSEIDDASDLEIFLIKAFYAKFGAIPVANGAFPKGLRKQKIKRIHSA